MKNVNADHVEDIARLVKKAKKGDKKAFTALYQNTWKPVYYMLFKKTGNKTDAEILLNEVYINVFVSIKDLESDITFYSWITKIASNAYLGFLRKNGKKETEELQITNEHMDSEANNTEEFLPDIALEKKENRELVMKTINELPNKQREAIYMFYYLDMKIKEIAKATNTAESTVLKRLHDARKSLKSKLGDLIKKGVIVYNMAGFIVLRELFQEDMLNIIDEKTGPTVLAKVYCNAAVRLAQKSAAQKAAKFFAIKFAAGTAVAGVTVGAIINAFYTRENLQPPSAVIKDYANNQVSIPQEIDLSHSPSPTIDIMPTQIPLATTAPTESEEVTTGVNLEAPSPRAEIIPQPSATLTQPAPPQPQPTITIAESTSPREVQPTLAAEQPTLTTDAQPITEAAQAEENTQITTMDIALVYEINKGPDERGLIKDISLYSRGAFTSDGDNITVLSNDFDFSKVGEYNMRLKAQATDGIIEIKATVRVIDTIAPNITIGNEKIYLQSGTILTVEEIIALANITVTDNSGEKIIPTILGYERIDFISPYKPEFPLIVNARDSAGNEAVQKHIFVSFQ